MALSLRSWARSWSGAPECRLCPGRDGARRLGTGSLQGTPHCVQNRWLPVFASLGWRVRPVREIFSASHHLFLDVNLEPRRAASSPRDQHGAGHTAGASYAAMGPVPPNRVAAGGTSI